MVNKDVVFEKVKQIQNCLRRIREKTQGHEDALDEIDIQDIFVLNLQRAIQTAIDLAAHVIADEGLGVPSELKENFVILEKADVITPKLSKKLQNMVGFRNIAVHEYSSINVGILKSVLKKDLKDIEEFYSRILNHGLHF